MVAAALLAALLPSSLRCGHAAALAAPQGGIGELLQEEAQRALREAPRGGEPAVQYVRFEVIEELETVIEAHLGGVTASTQQRRRRIAVEMQSDCAKRVRGRSRSTGTRSQAPLPLEDHPQAVRACVQAAVAEARKQARLGQALASARTSARSSAEGTIFELRPPARHVAATPWRELPRSHWEQQMRLASSRLAEVAGVIDSSATLRYQQLRRTLVTSEGTLIEDGQALCLLDISAQATALDGDLVTRSSSLHTLSLEGLPSTEHLLHLAGRCAAELSALRQAPKLEPYAGPAILSGAAAAIFFHETLGHRLEGQRQDDDEGQTLRPRSGASVLPPFLSVEDDPTLETLEGVALNGHYRYDNEGVPAQRVLLIAGGQVCGLLQSREPTAGELRSNGHGRCAPGFRPVARQANLVVRNLRPSAADSLRQQLLERCRATGLPYGLYLADVSAGSTTTSRNQAQAFQIEPTMVYRVWVDGRPDELVRGVNLIGTPLTSLLNIVATGSSLTVKNGYCGAESGFVPVSTSAPSVLVSQLETERQRAAPAPTFRLAPPTSSSQPPPPTHPTPPSKEKP